MTVSVLADGQVRLLIRRSGAISVCLFALLLLGSRSEVLANERSAAGQPFTVSEGVRIAHFGDPYTHKAKAITESPNGKYVAVDIERGLIRANRVEDELRIYSMRALREFAERKVHRSLPGALWVIREATYSVGPLIQQIRWLRNSRGITFLLTDGSGKNRLWLAFIHSHVIRALTLPGQDVMSYDVIDQSHYAYTVRDMDSWRRAARNRAAASSDATGQSLYDLLFPLYEYPRAAQWRESRAKLWAATGAAPRMVRDPQTHEGVVIFQQGQMAMKLGPGGRLLETVMPVPKVPLSWARTYQAPPGHSTYYAIRPGRQNLDVLGGEFLVSEYATIDLTSGRIQYLTGAPTGAAAGWWGGELVRGAWAGNGEAVILPDTFLADETRGAERRPCVAIATISSKKVECVTHLASAWDRSAAGYFAVTGARFWDHSDRRVVVEYRGAHGTQREANFVRTASGRWAPIDARASSGRSEGVKLGIRQGLNDPPLLVVTDISTNVSRVIWNPNPQLTHVALGKASIFHWTDRTGRRWTGGLYEPAEQGTQRLPLVIQTHGFNEAAFRPSGVIPTAFAARSLAAAGMVVLQMGFCGKIQTFDEIQCQLAGYAAAIRKLRREGIIDSRRVGIIGFSRTVSYVMAALTDPRLHFQAASVTDGVDDGYLQYMTSVDLAGDDIERDADAVIGAAPFGVGLNTWLARSPEFNLDKVQAPLLVVSAGIPRTLSMWGPYAGLRLLRKPVDMIVLNTQEHVLTSPAERIASQGGSVDWFRFWLQGYESPHPVMVGEYRRWEELCDMQIMEHGAAATSCVPTSGYRSRGSTPVRRAGNLQGNECSQLCRRHAPTAVPSVTDPAA